MESDDLLKITRVDRYLQAAAGALQQQLEEKFEGKWGFMLIAVDMTGVDGETKPGEKEFTIASLAASGITPLGMLIALEATAGAIKSKISN